MIKNILDVFTILFLFSLFGISHSVLASRRIKYLVKKYFIRLMAFYRLAYVISSLLFFYLVYILAPRPGVDVYELNYPLVDFIILFIRLAALAGIIWTLKYFCVREFLGINQVIRWLNKSYDPDELDEKMTFMISGPYKFVRHPLYFFTIILLAAKSEMNLFYLTMLICIAAYFYIGSFYEEKKLVEKFGDRYVRYQNEVPRLFPVKILKPYKSESIIS